jgi:hypothetical protein
MPATKTPTSSLSGTSQATPHYSIYSLRCFSTAIAIELLVNQLWYRTEAKIKRLFCEHTPEVPTGSPSLIAKFPQELVEAAISYLIYDTRALLACSMTCYSWYIAAVPHLHHSLTTFDDRFYGRPGAEKYFWPGPLEKSYHLGLLPLVKRFWIRLGMGVGYTFGFTHQWLGRRTLTYFSALTNLQELGIDNLRVSSFMPNILRSPVLPAPLTNTSITHPPCAQGFLPGDLVFHRTLSEPPRSQA